MERGGNDDSCLKRAPEIAMMLRTLLICAVVLVSTLRTAFAAPAGAYTPAPGSAERRAIMDALRAPVEKDLKRKVIFLVRWLKVYHGRAFLEGIPLKPDHKPMDYHGTPYQEAINGGAFGGGIDALLYQKGGKWRVRVFVIGATDVVYLGWDKKYGAPASIFPDVHS